MVANKEYFRPEHPYAPQKYGRIPLLDEINITYHASRVAGKEAFLNGEIDFYQPSGTLDTALSRELLDKVRDALCFAVHFWACCPLGLYFQYKNPVFQDIRVRQAISLGIDRQKVWEGGLEKTGLPGGGPVALYYTGQAENPPPVEDYGANAMYDPERAKQLLREAGLEPPLKLSVYETVGGISADFHAALEAVVFSLRQSGVADISIVERDAVVFANDRLTGSFPDLMYNTPGTLTFGLTLDSAVGPVMRTGSPNNPGSLSDPELDALLDKYSLLVNPDDAIRTAKEIQQRIVDNVDNVWFGWVGGLMIAQNWFKGQLVSPDGFVTGAATSNGKYTWIDDTAPGGRAGTEKVSG
jgi:ABC-type transport system substrate-binding protein